MQRAGDICNNCKDRWEAKKKPAKKLQSLPNSTLHKRIRVVACAYCDGGTLKIAALNNHDDPFELA